MLVCVLYIIYSCCVSFYCNIPRSTSAWIPPPPINKYTIYKECVSLALRDPLRDPKSRYSFHSNVHATLNLPNHSNYVPFESVKHRFHPFLADETWSFREHSHKHNCTRLIRGVSQNSHSYWPMACHRQPQKLFIRLMPKGFNILGSYCLFLYLSLSLSLFIISPTWYLKLAYGRVTVGGWFYLLISVN